MLPKVKLIVRRAQVRLFKVVLRVGLIKMLATVGPFTAKVSTLSMMHIDAETSLKESSIKQMDQRYLCLSDQNRICLLLFITANMILYVQIHDMENSTRVLAVVLSGSFAGPQVSGLLSQCGMRAVGKGRQDNHGEGGWSPGPPKPPPTCLLYTPDSFSKCMTFELVSLSCIL